MKMHDEARAAFADAYRFYEECWDMPDTVEAWESRAKKMGDLLLKYPGNNLAAQLVVACYDAMDADARDARKAFGQ